MIAFCDHWKALTGTDPATLVLDQKVTTQAVLGQLDARGVRFITLRMRSPALLRHIDSLDPKAWRTVALDRPGNYRNPKVVDEPAVKLSNYPGTVRQLIDCGALSHRILLAQTLSILDYPTMIIRSFSRPLVYKTQKVVGRLSWYRASACVRRARVYRRFVRIVSTKL